MNRTRFTILAAAVGLTMLARAAVGDAFVVTQAMKATSIAEIFIETDRVRVELEIGILDLKAFENLLPDELYLTLENEPRPLKERLEQFFESDLVIRAGGPSPLPGTLDRMSVRPRVLRDDVTGEPLADQPPDGEPVVFATLTYDLVGQPASLSIRAPSHADSDAITANIGFVAYHNGLPINDFRYLPLEATVDLDWDDPWYSRFRNRNLHRQQAAPMGAYLYVEPFEVRKEIILRPRDLEAWLDLGIGDAEIIPVEAQAALKDAVAAFLSNANPLTIDGQPASGRLDRIHFLHRTLQSTGIIDPPEDLDATSAMLGVIFSYPISTLPDQVSMTWELFSERIGVIPAVASDEAGGLPSMLTPDDPVLRWQNFLTNPTVPQLAPIRPPRARVVLPMFTVILGAAAIPFMLVITRARMSRRRIPRRAVVIPVCLALLGVVLWGQGRVNVGRAFLSPTLSADERREVVEGLLYNVYRAFDYPDETMVYDQLARTVTGDLLEQVYLNTRRSMEVANQGGLRVAVKEVVVEELEPAGGSDDGGIVLQCQWRVSGSVGHWGHQHQRTNTHRARLTVTPIDDAWKLTRMDVLDTETAGSPGASKR